MKKMIFCFLVLVNKYEKKSFRNRHLPGRFLMGSVHAQTAAQLESTFGNPSRITA